MFFIHIDQRFPNAKGEKQPIKTEMIYNTKEDWTRRAGLSAKVFQLRRKIVVLNFVANSQKDNAFPESFPPKSADCI